MDSTQLQQTIRGVALEVLGEDELDEDCSLIELGLDSLSAQEMVGLLEDRHGISLDYGVVMEGSSLRELYSQAATSLVGAEGVHAGPEPTSPIDVAFGQAMWLALEERGWGSWANLTLCLSFDVAVAKPAYIAAALQSVCDKHAALRTSFTTDGSGGYAQKIHTAAEFALPVSFSVAPRSLQEALRAAEAFEAEPFSPFETPPTRALVMCADAGSGSSHYICLCCHHVNVDNVSLRVVQRDLIQLVQGGGRPVESPSTSLNFHDCALWVQKAASERETQRQFWKQKLHGLVFRRPTLPPHIGLGDLTLTPRLDAVVAAQLTSLARQVGTTLPLLMHTLLAVLLRRLTASEDDGKEASADEVLAPLCHVVANREQHSFLRDVVGSIDTSIPVLLHAGFEDTVEQVATRCRHEFAAAMQHSMFLSRGEFMSFTADSSSASDLFEALAHINITSTVGTPAEGIAVHSLKRVQRPRWGLLMRMRTPPCEGSAAGFEDGQAFLQLEFYSEQRQLASTAAWCMVRLIGRLLSDPNPADVLLVPCADAVVSMAALATAQVQRSGQRVPRSSASDAFIWQSLVERQRRWYEHDEQLQLKRDSVGRFVGTPDNPFPFTQLDKLAERRFLEQLDVPMPTLLFTITSPSELISIQSQLPASFVIKPVGGGHSFGVTVVRDGRDTTRGGIPFDAQMVASEAAQLVEAGGCWHEGNFFRLNVSAFLIEDLVVDEAGRCPPTDYKCFVLGARLLWVCVVFHQDNGPWCAFVDSNFRLLPQPAFDPVVCWRTHRMLVCTDEGQLPPRPSCFEDIISESTRLGAKLAMYVRLDWYADASRGALFGEVTLFPHMLQPRTFYSTWANQTLRSLWRGRDGCDVPNLQDNEQDIPSTTTPKATSSVQSAELPSTWRTLPDAIPRSDSPWAVVAQSASSAAPMSTKHLHQVIGAFDLSAWGIRPGARVALLIPNGAQLAVALLCTMTRYCAVPLDAAAPAAAVVHELRRHRVSAALAMGDGTAAATTLHSAVELLAGGSEEDGRHEHTPVVVELLPGPGCVGDLVVPAPPTGAQLNGFIPADRSPASTLVSNSSYRQIDDLVLILGTSGTTGDSKSVGYTLGKLLRAGWGISRSLDLKNADVGLNMLPLHHVGGISCNLLAPLFSGSAMIFAPRFDSTAFLRAASEHSLSWSYLVPPLWEQIALYLEQHKELTSAQWPALRVLRSAGSALPHSLALRLASLFGPRVSVMPTYGLSEAMPVCAPPVDYKLEKPNSVGRVLPGVTLTIVSPTATEHTLPPSEIGEIVLSGPNVFDGYLDADGALQTTGPFTTSGQFRTGDLGCIDEDGWVFITGRSKEVINRGGETISPVDVEEALTPLLGRGAELIAFAAPHQLLHETVAVAVAPLSARVGLTLLRNYASERLSSAQVPQLLLRMDKLPRGATGKPMRARLSKDVTELISPLQLSEQRVYVSGDSGARVGPPDSVAGDLLLIEEWNAGAVALTSAADGASAFASSASALRAEDIIAVVVEVASGLLPKGTSVDGETELLTMGLNSLSALELAARLGERFQGSPYPPSLVYDYPTPSKIAAMVASSYQPRAEKGQQPSEGQGPAPLPTVGKRLRILMLHGEAADADLFNMMLIAARWKEQFSDFEFVLIDAPHESDPKPQFHVAADVAGLYNRPQYRSWRPTDADAVATSVALVEEQLEQHGPYVAIGGICDGALIAALVASRASETRPELRLFLSVAAPPLTRLVQPWRDEVHVGIPSLHILGQRDELFSPEQLRSLSARCPRAELVEHPGGHVLPTADTALAQRVRSAVLGSNDADPLAVLGVPLVGGPPTEHSTPYDAPGGLADDDADSITRLASLARGEAGSRPSMSEAAIVTAHARFVCIVSIVFAHSRFSFFSIKELHIGLAAQRFQALKAFFFYFLLPTFMILAGAQGQRARITGKQLVTLAAIIWLLTLSGLPAAAAAAMQHASEDSGPELPPNIDEHRLFLPIWFLLLLLFWQGAAFAAEKWSLRAQRLLPWAALVAHFLLPREPLKEVQHIVFGDGWLQVPQRLTELVTDATINFWVMGWLYFSVPRVLPHNFPARLPGEIGGSIRRSCVRLAWAAAFLAIGYSVYQLRGEDSPHAEVVSKTRHAYSCIGVVKNGINMCADSRPVETWQGWLTAACTDALGCVLSVVAAVGLCACMPRQTTIFTRPGGWSLLILVGHEYVLSPLEVPLFRLLQSVHTIYHVDSLALSLLLSTLIAMACVEVPLFVFACASALIKHIGSALSTAAAFGRSLREEWLESPSTGKAAAEPRLFEPLLDEEGGMGEVVVVKSPIGGRHQSQDKAAAAAIVALCRNPRKRTVFLTVAAALVVLGFGAARSLHAHHREQRASLAAHAGNRTPTSMQLKRGDGVEDPRSHPAARNAPRDDANSSFSDWLAPAPPPEDMCTGGVLSSDRPIPHTIPIPLSLAGPQTSPLQYRGRLQVRWCCPKTCSSCNFLHHGCNSTSQSGGCCGFNPGIESGFKKCLRHSQTRCLVLSSIQLSN